MKVGHRLLGENLQQGRAAYDKWILATVSQELMPEYRRGFRYAEIARMIQFAPMFPNEAIVATIKQVIEHARESAARRLPDAED